MFGHTCTLIVTHADDTKTLGILLTVDGRHVIWPAVA